MMRTEPHPAAVLSGIPLPAAPWWKAWRRAHTVQRPQNTASPARNLNLVEAAARRPSAPDTPAHPHTPDEDAYLRRLRQAGL